MVISEAKAICRRYHRLTNPSEEDLFLYTEALGYLIRETGNEDYMLELGSVYYEHRDFGLALKYYEMAAEKGSLPAISCLGYIWYYGRTGVVDHAKAFHYFDTARKMGDMISAYKVADMYRNGYYVEKDPARYREIIEGLYREMQDLYDCHAGPVPEVWTRLAKIRAEEGKTDEALRLYDEAREILSERLQEHLFFGDLTIMKWLIRDICQLREFDAETMELYDLFYVLASPAIVRFTFEETVHTAESAEEDGGMAVCLDGKWYRTADDLFMKAELGGVRITALYEELYDWEVTWKN